MSNSTQQLPTALPQDCVTLGSRQFIASKVRIGLLLVLLSGLVLPGCSLMEPAPSPATRQTVLSVAANYLQFIVQGNDKRLTAIVSWQEYLLKNKEGLTREELSKQIALGQGRWTPETHPLLNLDVRSLDVNGDSAKVTLQRVNAKGFPVIWVKMAWTGSGWLIVDDSLFSADDDTLFGELAQKQKSKAVS